MKGTFKHSNICKLITANFNIRTVTKSCECLTFIRTKTLKHINILLNHIKITAGKI